MGIMEHADVMWIIMAASLTFMSVVVGFYYLRMISIIFSPLNKLRYSGTIINHDLDPLSINRSAKRSLVHQGMQATRNLSRIQIGVSLYNSGHFPISARLELAETTIESLTPPRVKYPRDFVTIFPGNNVFMIDEAIDMKGHPCDRIEGKMKIIVKYGNKNDEKYELSFIGKIEAFFQPNGFMQGNYTHWESDQV